MVLHLITFYIFILFYFMDNDKLLTFKSYWSQLPFFWFKLPFDITNNQALLKYCKEKEKLVIFKGKKIIGLDNGFSLYFSIGKSYILYFHDNYNLVALTSMNLNKLYFISLSFFNTDLIDMFKRASFLTDYDFSIF